MPPSRPSPDASPAAQPATGITLILNRAIAGDERAREQLYGLLYAELMRLARSHLFGSGALSLDPSALVHEAYLRMLGREATPMRDRRAFFAYASAAMRSVLLDHVRAAQADKRGGGATRVTLTTGVLDSAAAEADFSRLNEALEMLRSVDERAFRVVELRYFAGMTEDDVAAELAISVPTVKRDWRKARAFLFGQLR
jgi:RNA polymerase sigma factor (TIGR02999 family)